MAVAVPVMIWAGEKVNNKISILLGFMGVYLIFRAGVEYFRDMVNIWWSLLADGPISIFQLTLIIMGLILIATAYLCRNFIKFATMVSRASILTRLTCIIIVSYIIVLSLQQRFLPALLLFIILLLGLSLITLVHTLLTGLAWGRLQQAVVISTLCIIALVPFIGKLEAKFHTQNCSTPSQSTVKPGCMRFMMRAENWSEWVIKA